MRLAPLLVLVLVLAACGSTTERTGVPASSGQESVPVDPSASTLPGAKLKPPPILLVSEVETQKAVWGSYCVDYVDEASGEGQGVCSDAVGPIYPRDVTAVAAGDRVTFILPAATLKAGSVVTIRPLGCTDRVTTEINLEPGGEHPWDVDLDHGAYQLDVFALFEAKDGRAGDVSGTLGLTVAGAKKWDALGVVAVKRAMQVCPFAD